MRAAAAAAPAGFVSRLLALVIDVVILLAILTGTRWFLDTVQEVLRPRGSITTELLLASAPEIAFLYFVLAWSLVGQTVGKWVLGLRVVTTDGRPVPIGAAAVRFVGYIVSSLPLYLGFLWVLFDPERRAWHDRLARTRVIYQGGAPPSGTPASTRAGSEPSGSRHGRSASSSTGSRRSSAGSATPSVTSGM